MTDFVWLNLAILIIVAVLFTTVSAQSKNPVVEGFAGGSVTLPCTLTGTGILEWKRDSDLILIKPPGRPAVIAEGPFRDSVELSGQTNLLIRSLAKARDNNREFTCTYVGGGATQVTPVRVLEKIGEAAIQESGDDTVSVTRGIPKTLTCTVTGDPNPDPSYSWRVDGGQVSSQGQTFSLTADRSMTTVTCTATNTYSNGTELSRKEVTSSLNVLYLDEPEVTSPVTVIEGESVTLQCSAEGNPPPGYEWRRSGTKEVISTSGRYPMDTVGRSAAGEYTCTVSNSVGGYNPTVYLIVQYPPDVTVTYDEPSQTLSCSADGVPPNYSFLPWEHRLGGKLLQTLGTASTQSPATLRFEDSLTYEDTGSYVCQVTNQIKGVQRGQVVVRPETPAIFQAEPRNVKLGIGKTEKISVPFYTSSESLSVEWQKYGQSSTLPSHQEETGSVSLTIRGESVTIEGNVTTLTLTNVTEDDEGNYTVTVTVNINSNSEKRVRVVSVTVEAITEEAPGAFPVGAVVGGVVGGVVFIVIIVVVIIVLRRRSPKPGGSDGKEEKGSVNEHLVRGAEQRGFTDPSWQDPDAEIATNDLYQSASFSRKLPPQDQRPAKPERTFTHKLKPDYVPPPGVRGRNKDQDMEMTENSVPSEKSVQNGAGRNRDTIEYEPTDLPSPSSRSQNNNRSLRKPGLSDEPVGGDGKRKAAVNPPKSPTPATDLDFVRRNRAY